MANQKVERFSVGIDETCIWGLVLDIAYDIHGKGRLCQCIHQRDPNHINCVIRNNGMSFQKRVTGVVRRYIIIKGDPNICHCVDEIHKHNCAINS